MSVQREIDMAKANGKIVFFAGVSPEMVKYRENLINELANFGCEARIFEDMAAEEDLLSVIEHCQLAIHILSDKDFAKGSSKKGLEEEQISKTANHLIGRKLMAGNGEEAFRIFAWHPKSLSESIYEQEKLSPHLTRIQQMEDVEFLRTTFEDFKYYLLKQINATKTYAHDVHFIKDDPRLSVFFLYDLSDKQQALPYLDFIKRRGYTVLTIVHEGDIMSARQAYNNNLKNFDVAIIYSQKAGVNWVNMKLMDILKSPGMGRDKDVRAKAVMMSQSRIAQCPMIARGFDVINLDDADINASLETYLKNIV